MGCPQTDPSIQREHEEEPAPDAHENLLEATSATGVDCWMPCKQKAPAGHGAVVLLNAAQLACPFV